MAQKVPVRPMPALQWTTMGAPAAAAAAADEAAVTASSAAAALLEVPAARSASKWWHIARMPDVVRGRPWSGHA